MLRSASSFVVVFAAACLLDVQAHSANAQVATEWSGKSVIDLGGLPGSTPIRGCVEACGGSAALAINDAGQVAGISVLNNNGGTFATEWSSASIINLGAGTPSSINNTGQVVGQAGIIINNRVGLHAVEWSGGSIIDLGGPPNFAAAGASGINSAGKIVGYSCAATGCIDTFATEWSGGSVIDLGGLPGAVASYADAINASGQVVGVSCDGPECAGNAPAFAAEWSGGAVIDLGGLPGSTASFAAAINSAGQVVGDSCFGLFHTGCIATEWSGGHVIDLGGLPGSTTSFADGINDSGQMVGQSCGPAGCFATEWSGGSIINLGAAKGFEFSTASGINDLGQVVGESFFGAVPEVPTWIMMLFGFACLGFLLQTRKAHTPPQTGQLGS